MKKQVWPNWVQVIDLPPRLWISRNNIALAGLFVGEGLPDWTELIPHNKGEVISGLELPRSENFDLHISFKFSWFQIWGPKVQC